MSCPNIIFHFWLYIVGNLITSVFKFLERWENWPGAIQATGIALLTIFIPLAIATLQDIYRRKRREDNAEFVDLDFNVVLDKVFGIKRLLFYAALIFIPTLLWGISPGEARLPEVIMSFVGITLMVISFFGMYNWIKGSVFEFRFSYLRNLNRQADLEIVWRSVWQTKAVNLQNERQFFDIFSLTINQLLQNHKKNLEILSNLLDGFRNNIDNRSTFFWSFSEEVYLRIFDWHFRVWNEEQSHLSQNQNATLTYQYFQIKYILGSIIQNMEEATLKRKEDFHFFRCFEKHINSHKEDYTEVQSEKSYYAKELLENFYNILFEAVVDYPTELYIWEDCFPNDWKITRNKIATGRIAKISLNRFLAWAQERIINPGKEYDDKLDVVVKNLFPDVEPTIWAKILIFVFSPYGESKLRSVIERHWNFGYIGRIRTYTGSTEDSETDFNNKMNDIMKSERERETRNTFELGSVLFNEQFSKESLQKYMEELDKLEYQKDSEKEHKRKSLLHIFSGMLEFLNRQTKPADELLGKPEVL
jgi:hypothetical protein